MLPQPGIDNATPAEEIAARIAALRTPDGGLGIDFCVIMQHVDLFYFTGSVQKAYPRGPPGRGTPSISCRGASTGRGWSRLFR